MSKVPFPRAPPRAPPACLSRPVSEGKPQLTDYARNWHIRMMKEVRMARQQPIRCRSLSERRAERESWISIVFRFQIGGKILLTGNPCHPSALGVREIRIRLGIRRLPDYLPDHDRRRYSRAACVSRRKTQGNDQAGTSTLAKARLRQIR